MKTNWGLTREELHKRPGWVNENTREVVTVTLTQKEFLRVFEILTIIDLCDNYFPGYFIRMASAQIWDFTDTEIDQLNREFDLASLDDQRISSWEAVTSVLLERPDQSLILGRKASISFMLKDFYELGCLLCGAEESGIFRSGSLVLEICRQAFELSDAELQSIDRAKRCHFQRLIMG